MKDPYEENLKTRLNRIVSGAYDRLEEIHNFDNDAARSLLGEILSSCCCGQHIAGILVGRRAFSRIPQTWLLVNAPDVVESVLDLSDEWEFRRLLEVLRETNSPLLKDYLKKGLASPQQDIRDAANDFSS